MTALPLRPSAGAPARLGAYLAETYPVPQRAAAAALVYGGMASLLARLHGREALGGWGGLLLGSWAVFAFLLVLRLMDELKDLDVDRALFPKRALPSGRVREADVAGLLGVVAALFVVAHAAAGWALVTAAAALAYAGLMFRWFFIPARMGPDLPLTLATHNPVVPLLLLHLATVYGETAALPFGQTRWASVLVLVGAGWAAFFAWEIARKIRSRAEEDDYVTYSRLLGPAGAVAVVIGAQTAGVAAGLALFAWHDLSPAFPAALAAGYAVALGGAVRFLAFPGPRTSRLRPFAEAYALALFAGGLVA